MFRAAAIGIALLACAPVVSHSAIRPTADFTNVASVAGEALSPAAVNDCTPGSSVLRKLVACGNVIRSRNPSQEALTGAYRNRGMAYYSLGEGERAVEDFDRALRLDPGNPDLYYIRGTAWQKLGDHSRAVEDFDQAIRLDPDHGAANASRGVSREKLGDDRGALADYDRALELNPDNASALNNRGNVRARLGQRRQAIEDYDRAIRMDPDHASAYHNRAGERCRAGMAGPAVADYLHAIRIGSRERDAMQEFLSGQGFLDGEDQPGAAALEEAVRRWGASACTDMAPAEAKERSAEVQH